MRSWRLGGPPVEYAHFSSLEHVLVGFGFPVVTGMDRRKPSTLTWTVALMLVALFVLQLVSGDAPEFISLFAYRPGESAPWTAFTANLIHFDLLHVLGNAFFLLAFGDAVEQRLPRALWLAAFFGMGTASLLLEGQFSRSESMIAGASGGVSALMGMAAVLAPKGRVTFRIGWRIPAIQVPLLVYVGVELAFQVISRTLGVPGVAWVAHGSALLMGATVALIARGVAARRRGSANVISGEVDARH